MKTMRQRLWVIPVIALAVMILGITYIVSSGDREAQAAEVDHTELVPEQPRRDLPVVLEGRVLAHAQVGDRIFVGGDFQQVQTPDGTILDQAYLFAYDINSGVLDPNFRPALNNVVRSLAPTQANDGLYVGGLFTRWDNSFPLRAAKLDAQGNLNGNWGPRASARVHSIVEVGNSVYLGGDFIEVSGTPARGLVKVDRLTGAVDTSFLPQYNNSINGSNIVKTVVVSPDQSSLFVMHYAQNIDDVVRQAVAKYDLDAVGGNPTLSDWHINWIQQNLASNCWRSLRDMDISPDGTFIVIGGQGADNPPNCDSVLRYPTAGNAEVTFDWSARMYSSVFSLAVSDVAVYAGGHFCAAPRNPAGPSRITHDPAILGRANRCDVNDPTAEFNPSVLFPTEAVFRGQMAALDPSTGQALDWDPGSNNLVAVYDLTLIDRGLLAGHDGSRFNNFGVGRSGLFDFTENPTDSEAPTIVATQPAEGSITSNPVTLGGTASDNFGVEEVFIRLNRIDTNEWLQADGSFGPDRVDLPTTTTTLGLGEIAWSTQVVGDLPAGLYEIRGLARDDSGNFSTALASQFTIAGSTQCTVALNADGVPVISYEEFQANNVDNVVVRRDGRWLASAAPGTGSFEDTSAEPGDHSYLIRWRPDGVRTDVPCTPDTINVPVPTVTATCSVGLNADSKPVITWSIEGVDRVAVREAGQGFVAIVDGVNTYTDSDAAPGDYSYIVRYTPPGGDRIDMSCTPAPLTVPDDGVVAGPTCNAAVNAAGHVVLNWSAIDGEDTYIVRDNDGWVAGAENVLTYTDTNPTPGDRTYVIRSRQGNTTTNVTCNPTVTVN